MATQSSPLYFYCIFVLLLVVGQVYCEIEFHSPTELAGLKIKSEQFMFIGPSKKLNVTGRLIASNPSHACSWDSIKNKDEFDGNIVLVTRDSSTPCSPVDKFKNAEKGGAIAIVYMMRYDEYTALSGSKFFGAGGIDLSGVQSQAYVKDSKGYDQILKYTKNETVTVMITLKGDDPNIHRTYYAVFSVLIGLFSLINLICAAYKLYLFIKINGKFKFNLPMGCLSTEIAANFLRIILCLEPDVGCGNGLIDFGTVSFLQSGSLPWAFISTLLIAFYWDHSLRAFGSKNATNWKILSIQKMKKPLAVVCVILVLGNLVGSAIQAAFLADRTVAVIMFVYWGICAFGVGVYFTISGIKVLNWAKGNKGNNGSSATKANKMARMTRLIVGTAAGLFWSVIALIIMTLTAESFFYGYIPVFLGLVFVSAMQIMIFTPGSTVASGTTSGGTHSKSGNTGTDKIEMPSTSTTSAKDVSSTTSQDVLLSSA